ncbi:MAG: TonB-dependent receptor [Rhodothermales bacterium]
MSPYSTIIQDQNRSRSVSFSWAGKRLAFASFLVALLCILTTMSASAQGTIRGVVSDSLDGSTLIGANVSLAGTAVGTATDENGAFRIDQIPAGDYTVRVSYIGYESKMLGISLADGETVTLNVTLAASVVIGGEIVVSGQLEGQTAAINQQLSSNTIVNVVSEEKIQELPDANAAESIGRLPGVSVQRSGGEANQIILRGLGGAFNNVTVDGVQLSPTDAAERSIDLSAISQGSLSGIELFKALTPDKDGDAIAGSVNFVTRRAPENREIRVDVLGSYNALAADASQYDADFRYGERILGGKLGVQLSGNIERRNRTSEEYDPDFDCSQNDFTVCQIDDLQLDYNDEIRERRGAGAILDVGTPDGGFIKLSSLYNETSRNLITYGRNYPTTGELLFYTGRDREQTIRVYSSALTGENHILGLNTDWGLSYSRSASDYPFDLTLSFTEPSTTDAEGTTISGMAPIPNSVRRGDPEGIIPFAMNNFEQAYLYSGFFRNEEASDADIAGYLDLEREYGIGTSIRGMLKFGGKFRSKSRNRNRTEVFSPYYNTPFPDWVQLDDGTVVPKDFSGTSFQDYISNGELVIARNFIGGEERSEGIFDDRFTLTPVLDRDLLREWYDLNQYGVRNDQGSDVEFKVNREPEVDFYDITERVAAGYLMSTLNIGKSVTWIAGLRVENENNDYASRYAPNGLDGVPVPTGSIRDTSSTYTQTVWLPNMHVSIRPTDFLTIRLAAYRALARPDFNNRLANTVARRAGFFFPGNSIVIGNPNLRTATAWNYEANASLFGPKLGLFSVSGFYKRIDDFFQVINGLRYKGSAIFEDLGIEYDSPFGNEAQFQLRVPYNLDEATTVYGLEVEHQTNFSYLSGPLSGIVLAYNFSVVRSNTLVPRVRVETTIVERPPFPPIETPIFVPYEQEQKLQRQPDFFANVSLGYDYKAFSVRLSMFHQAAFTTSFAANTQIGNDGLRDSYTRLDLAMKQAIGNRVWILLNVNNLTGVEERSISYNSVLNRRLVNNSEIYGATVDLGLRLTF